MNIKSSYLSLLPLTWMLFLGYGLLLAYFAQADIYHHFFFTNGWTVIGYNLLRIGFICYLLWLFYAVGEGVWQWMKPSNEIAMKGLERALLGFFLGAGVLHIILFLMGLAGYYTRTIMALLTLGILFFSLPQLDQWLRYARDVWRNSKDHSPWIILFLFAMIGFLMTKGLYPAGGHDYYDHYFHYYKKVVETGSILPNAIWYHFYYCKGAALFFLSMLLTDPLGPQLASAVMIFAGAAMVFHLVRQATTWKAFAWIGAALYLLFLIYTPGPLENRYQGGWGDLEKPHEPAAVLVFAILWLTIGLAQASSRRIWGMSLISTVCALVCINPAMSLFAGLYLFIAAISFYYYQRKETAIWLFAGAVAWGIGFSFTLGLNYFLTGIPLDQGILAFWPIVHFDKVKEWGVLFETIVLHLDRASMAAQSMGMFELGLKMLTYLRLDVWGGLFVLIGVTIAWRLFHTNTRFFLFTTYQKLACVILGGFLLFTLLLSFFLGKDQPISFYRFTTFSYAPTLCVCLVLLAVLFLQAQKKKIALLIGLIVLQMIVSPLVREKKYAIPVLRQGLNFIVGKYSLAEAYQHQKGWPARMAWGGVYPPMEKIWRSLPSHPRIWSMHIHSYCMLPDCHVEGYSSFRFSRQAEQIYFGAPFIAKQILKNENLNYFFFSTALVLTDPLPRAPLFSPDHIAQYLGIAFTDGVNTLLTWKEDAMIAIDETWLNHYREKIKTAVAVQSFQAEKIQQEMDAINSTLLG